MKDMTIKQSRSLQKEIKKWKKVSRDREDITEDAENYMCNAARRLKEKLPGTKKGDWETSIAATSIARFLTFFVHDWDCGEYLCIDWVMERFMGIMFHRHMSKVTWIYQYLIDNKHDCKNPCEKLYDSNIYYINSGFSDSDNHWDYRRITSLNNKGRYYLFIDEGNCISRRFHVRQMNPTTYLRKGLAYSDCRDKGYVLTWEEICGSKGKIEWAYRHYDEIKHILWLIRLMYSAVKEDK